MTIIRYIIIHAVLILPCCNNCQAFPSRWRTNFVTSSTRLSLLVSVTWETKFYYTHVTLAIAITIIIRIQLSRNPPNFGPYQNSVIHSQFYTTESKIIGSLQGTQNIIIQIIVHYIEGRYFVMYRFEGFSAVVV